MTDHATGNQDSSKFELWYNVVEFKLNLKNNYNILLKIEED